MSAEDELVIRASHAAVRSNGWVNAASECTPPLYVLRFESTLCTSLPAP